MSDISYYKGMKRIRLNNDDFYGKNIKGTVNEKIFVILFWVFVPIPFILAYYVDIEYIEYISASILGLTYFLIIILIVKKTDKNKK